MARQIHAAGFERLLIETFRRIGGRLRQPPRDAHPRPDLIIAARRRSRRPSDDRFSAMA